MLWSAFYPDLIPAAMGCPNPQLDKDVRYSAIEFFRRTKAWVEWLDPDQGVEGATEYDFDLPNGAEVFIVKRATVDGSNLSVLSYRDADKDPAQFVEAGQAALSPDAATIRFGYAVAAGAKIQVQAVLVPTQSATGLPDALFNQYREAIACGALARLQMGSPDTPWYRPDLAMLNQGKYDAAIASMAVDAWRGHTHHTPRARPSFC